MNIQKVIMVYIIKFMAQTKVRSLYNVFMKRVL